VISPRKIWSTTEALRLMLVICWPSLPLRLYMKASPPATSGMYWYGTDGLELAWLEL
jgi:hypothetical protein